MSKQLFILRHADSAFLRNENDIDRPLTERGQQRAQLLGNRLKHQKINPGLIYCSPAKRTRETMKLLNLSSQIKIEDILYNGTTGDYLELIKTNDNDCESLLIVGHNPSVHGMARFFSLSRDNLRLFSYPPCTLTSIELDIKSWDKIGPNSAIKIDVFTPDLPDPHATKPL